MKELEVELPEDANRDKIMKEIEAALSGEKVLWLTDRKGRRVGVPAQRIAYVEFGTPIAIVLWVSARPRGTFHQRD